MHVLPVLKQRNCELGHSSATRVKDLVPLQIRLILTQLLGLGTPLVLRSALPKQTVLLLLCLIAVSRLAADRLPLHKESTIKNRAAVEDWPLTAQDYQKMSSRSSASLTSYNDSSGGTPGRRNKSWVRVSNEYTRLNILH